ncbi:BTAD domain-containing putative transcriptional regulator [Streptomyces sp. BRA346]|uniref:BTAD domain-containing putative transcriptional regulator n=1 Tax=Streptomyces sp. BRA346 TaxID=2878199 RepID=UPI004062EDDF
MIPRPPGSHLFCRSAVLVGLHRLHRLTAAARDHDGRVALLRQALDLWRGDALSGLTGAWAEAARARLADERLAARLELYEATRHRLADDLAPSTRGPSRAGCISAS